MPGDNLYSKFCLLYRPMKGLHNTQKGHFNEIGFQEFHRFF